MNEGERLFRFSAFALFRFHGLANLI